MHILDVIPVVKIPKGVSQVLSYFSKEDLQKGSVVSVPLGRAKVNALVVESYPIDKEKINIRRSSFQMKSIDKVISEEPLLSKKQLKLFLWFLKYYSSPVGLTAKTFLPSYVVRKKTKIKNIDKIKESTQNKKTKKDIFIFKKDPTPEYKKEIKEVLQKDKQILFLVPDIYSLDHYKKHLKEFNPELISSQLSPKKNFDAWLRIKAGKSKLIISTRMGVFLNFQDLGLIILDQENEQAYKSRDMMPYYHVKDVALKLAELSEARVVFSSCIPDISTYWLVKNKNINLLKPNLGVELLSKLPMLIDMRNEIHGGNYSILSYQLQQELEKIKETGKQAIFFISRRGAETFVFCRDCGYVEKCPNCEVSLIHHKERNESKLVCHQCGFKRQIQLKCPKCKGHRIKYFGAGTQNAKEEVLKLFPNMKVDILDSDITPTIKEQKPVIDNFNSKKTDVLIGTQLLFKKNMLKKAYLICVLSLDNMLHLPDFRSKERVFRVLKNMSFLCKKSSEFYLQSYSPESPILENIKKLDYEDFYQEEIMARKIFSYPPFASLIKLIYKNKDKNFSERHSKEITEKIKKLELSNVKILGPAPAYVPRVRNEYVFQIVVKIKNSENAEKEKSTLLKNIPEGWIVDVDPESLL